MLILSRTNFGSGFALNTFASFGRSAGFTFGAHGLGAPLGRLLRRKLHLTKTDAEWNYDVIMEEKNVLDTTKLLTITTNVVVDESIGLWKSFGREVNRKKRNG